MNIKMLVTDIDGTLLPAGMEVPRRNVEAVQRAARAGVTVTVATGRMYRAALPVARALGVDVPIITYNGAVIKSVSGKVYDENFLSPAVVREALTFCRARGWHVQLYADDVLYFAMGNAQPAVKAVCELSVGDCEAGGFAEAVERYVL